MRNPQPLSSGKDYEAYRRAQVDWRALCAGTEDAKTGLRQYMVNHPGIRPEAFNNNGRYKTRKGYEFLRGKSRKGVYEGGPLGKARVLARQPLELRRISFAEIPELKSLETDLSLQFMPKLVKFAINALKPHIVGPAFGCVENGRTNKRNHFHVFVTPGGCKLGASSGTIPDEQLPQRAAYLGKGPCFDFETALAYLRAKQNLLSKSVADRYFSFRLGNRRTHQITLEMIEEALGYSLAKPEAVELLPVPVEVVSQDERAQAFAALPVLRSATPQESEQVMNLHRVWAEGRCDGVPLKLPGRTCPDLGRTLYAYFEARTRLFPGEVADLVEIASVIDLSVDAPQPIMRKRNHIGHVRPYRLPHHESRFQTGHVG